MQDPADTAQPDQAQAEAQTQARRNTAQATKAPATPAHHDVDPTPDWIPFVVVLGTAVLFAIAFVMVAIIVG